MKNNKLKILMLLESAFPPDIRVEKEAKSLLAAGFELSLVCAATNKVVKIDNWNGMKLYRVPVKYDNFSKLLRIFKIVKFDFFFYLKNFLNNESYDVIHVHDLKLVPTALKIKEIYPNIKVVADLHENYPAAVREWTKLAKGLTKLIYRLFNNYERWLKIETEVVKKVDHIIAVVEEMKDRMLNQQATLEATKITVVSNLEDKDFVQEGKIDNAIVEKYKDYSTILYIGGFGVHRGIDTAIKAMKYIDIKNIKLLLVGKGTPEVDEYFLNLIKDNKLESKVEIVGWQPFDKVLTYQKLADICIVPHNSNEHTDNTIPHKIYQYMMVGKPMLVSSCPPLARVTKASNAGLVFEAGNSYDFAAKIKEMFKDKEMMKKFEQNGIDYTFNKDNNWQQESKKLIKLYEDMR